VPTISVNLNLAVCIPTSISLYNTDNLTRKIRSEMIEANEFTAFCNTTNCHVNAGLSAVLTCTDVSKAADSSRLGFFNIVIKDKAPTFRMNVIPSCSVAKPSVAAHCTFSEGAVARVKTDGKVASALITTEPTLMSDQATTRQAFKRSRNCFTAGVPAASCHEAPRCNGAS
jgi:hypothetical protein